MPVRTYERKFYGGPHEMTVAGFSIENSDDIEKLNKSLVFLDLNTGLNNRSIVRDPICGLGDLPAEIDILEGCALKRVNEPSDSNGVSPSRDPIQLKGDLGEEYNCLYTTKSLTCKDSNDRNIITLQGDLGAELDHVRPHGGKPRSSIRNEAVRNPITGSGDFGSKEWDPIWKYDGKHVINRPEQVQRDPITHSVPIENMGESPTKFHFKHFDVTKSTDFISHDESIKDLRNNDELTHCHIRHFNDPMTRNPITHEDKEGYPKDKPYRSGTKHFYDKINNEDHIRHHGFDDDIIERNAKEESAREQAKTRVINDPIRHDFPDESDAEKAKEKQTRLNSEGRILRNPIVGTGIEGKDLTILCNTSGHSFRSYETPQSKKTSKPNAKEPTTNKSAK